MSKKPSKNLLKNTTISASLSFRNKASAATAVLIGLFVFYTSFFGSFETLIQRSIFVSMITVLGLLMFPLGRDRSWRVFGIILDIISGLLVISATIYIVINFENIMNDMPVAKDIDTYLGLSVLLVILELARRTASALFPIMVGSAVIYAYFGDLIPGVFGHSGFDIDYLTEIIFLSDRGLWGMLVGIASTTLAAFVLFGSLLLHTGAGQTFFDLSARAGGSSPGGAAKIATVASGLFGSISGSSVANVATTGNFTIPLMKRLNYPPAFAGGVEAIASTGGQLAPPIMGTAAFVMAELIGENYWIIALAALLPAILLYVGIFTSVHLIAKRRGLGSVSSEDLPDWRSALRWRRLAPIAGAATGLTIGIAQGNSIGLTACYGMIGIVLTFVIASLSEGISLKVIGSTLMRALEDGGRGVLIVGVLLVSAQVFVAIINLTGVGIAITSAILAFGEGNIWLIAIIMAVVCLVVGMGLPTSAAYVLVAAVFAPALIQLGLDPLAVHLFVLYYAALSVVTPPVCVGVFVAAMISGETWGRVAAYALRLGGTAYVIPMLFLIYPGLLFKGGFEAIALGVVSGLGFTLAFASFFAAQPMLAGNKFSWCLWLIPGCLAIYPDWITTIGAIIILIVAYKVILPVSSAGMKKKVNM
jgi:TRAP transporter 4TM/12TM fusion protein